MELPVTESHVYLLDIKSSPSLIGQNNNRTYVFHQVEFVDKITTWKLKTPGGILLLQVLVQVCPTRTNRFGINSLTES